MQKMLQIMRMPFQKAVIERPRIVIWFLADTLHMLVFPFLWLTVYGATKYPLDVFSKPIRIFLLTVVPVGLMSYTPTVTLLQKSTEHLVLLSWIVAGIFLATSYIFFRFALRRYTSASS